MSEQGFWGIHSPDGWLAFRFHQSAQGEQRVEIGIGRRTRTLSCREFIAEMAPIIEEARKRVFDTSTKGG